MNTKPTFYDIYRQQRVLLDECREHIGNFSPEIQEPEATISFGELPKIQDKGLFRFKPFAFVSSFGSDGLERATGAYYFNLPPVKTPAYTTDLKEGLEESGKVFPTTRGVWLLAVRVSEQTASGYRLPLDTILLARVSPELLDSISACGALAYFNRLVVQATRTIASPVLEETNRQRYEVWRQDNPEGSNEGELVSSNAPSKKGRSVTRHFDRKSVGLFWQGDRYAKANTQVLWSDLRKARDKALQNT
jgi:hypothetical protein